jgi:hypothetical protein
MQEDLNSAAELVRSSTFFAKQKPQFIQTTFCSSTIYTERCKQYYCNVRRYIASAIRIF